jgi:RLL motif-containing protein 1
VSVVFSAPPAAEVAAAAAATSDEAKAEAEVERRAIVAQLGGADGADATAALRVLREELAAKMSAAAAAPRVAAPAPGDDGVGTGDLSSIDLGFSTDDAALDHAAKILRMLYVEQLRKLQSDVNGVIATAQNFTADPRTDSRLGKVGRG